MLRRIDRVVLRVENLDSAVKYYHDTLGLTVLRQDPRTHVATLRLADGQDELVLHADPNMPADATYFLVDDVRQMHQQREQLRLHFITAPAPAARGYTAS